MRIHAVNQSNVNFNATEAHYIVYIVYIYTPGKIQLSASFTRFIIFDQVRIRVN